METTDPMVRDDAVEASSASLKEETISISCLGGGIIISVVQHGIIHESTLLMSFCLLRSSLHVFGPGCRSLPALCRMRKFTSWIIWGGKFTTGIVETSMLGIQRKHVAMNQRSDNFDCKNTTHKTEEKALKSFASFTLSVSWLLVCSCCCSCDVVLFTWAHSCALAS